MEMELVKAYKYNAKALEVEEAYYEEEKRQENIDAIWDTLLKGRAQMQELYSHLFLEDESQAEIFEAHIRILEDEELLEKVLSTVETEGATAKYAIAKVFDEYIDYFTAAEDSMLADKVFDLRDMKEYLLRIMCGGAKQELANIKEEVILVARELLPSEVLSLNPTYVKGIIMEKGGEWSHAAILAKARGIPVQVGAIGIWNKVKNGDMLPAMGQVEDEYCDAKVVLQDGSLVEIGINVDGPDWSLPGECYDFVGLYRTEIQYIQGHQLPTEEELFEEYKKAVIQADGKMVTFRTMDMGGDKLPQYFMGVTDREKIIRGIQFSFQNPELYQTQLRAILRASAYGQAQIMFPMVETLEDIFQARAFVQEAMIQLEKTGQTYNKDIRIGVMIETFSIARLASKVVEEVDFASIGTNDLIESLSGVARSDIDTHHYGGVMFDKLFELLRNIFMAFEQGNKPVSVCGAMAGEEEGATELVRLGARYLSMNPAEVSKIRESLMKLEM